jgi:flagellar FliL protein
MVSDGPTNTTKGGVQPTVKIPYGSLRDVDPEAILKEINRLLTNLDPSFERSFADVNAADLATDERLSSESLEIEKDMQSSESSSQRGQALPSEFPQLTLADSLIQVREDVTASVFRVLASLSQIYIDLKGLFSGDLKENLPKSKEDLKTILKNFLSNLKKTSKKTVLSLFVILFLSALCGLILYRTYKGNLLPKNEVSYLRSFETVADHAYKYKEDEPLEEFDSPLRHPEYVFALDKVIVNLKGKSASSTSMGMFEFYIETSSQEAAVEVSDRENEVRDIVSRTIENISYDEVITPDGKNKLKLLLRVEINKILTQGRVRKVFFKSIILKP